MKKQVVFYLIWDVLFTIFLYGDCVLSKWAEHSYHRFEHIYLAIFTPTILSILIGGFFCVLIYISSQYKLTRKSAILELLIVGGLALYLSTMLFFPNVIFFITGGTVPRFFTLWWTHIETPITVGSILLGYELFLFAIRMVKCKKIKNSLEI